MVGNHSSGEHSRHSLVPVTEAYQSVVEASQGPDPIIDERKKTIKGQLKKVEKRGQNLLQNVQLVKDQIESIYQKAITDLENQTANKVTKLVCWYTIFWLDENIKGRCSGAKEGPWRN